MYDSPTFILPCLRFHRRSFSYTGILFCPSFFKLSPHISFEMADDFSSSMPTPESPSSIPFNDESTALLPKVPLAGAQTNTPQYRQWLAEIWLLTKASIPVILAYTLQNSLQTISVLIVGRLSPEALATAAFCYS